MKDQTPLQQLLKYMTDGRDYLIDLPGDFEQGQIAALNNLIETVQELLPEERKAFEDAYYVGWTDGFYPEHSKHKTPQDYFTDKYGQL